MIDRVYFLASASRFSDAVKVIHKMDNHHLQELVDDCEKTIREYDPSKLDADTMATTWGTLMFAYGAAKAEQNNR